MSLPVKTSFKYAYTTLPGERIVDRDFSDTAVHLSDDAFLAGGQYRRCKFFSLGCGAVVLGGILDDWGDDAWSTI